MPPPLASTCKVVGPSRTSSSLQKPSGSSGNSARRALVEASSSLTPESSTAGRSSGSDVPKASFVRLGHRDEHVRNDDHAWQCVRYQVGVNVRGGAPPRPALREAPRPTRQRIVTQREYHAALLKDFHRGIGFAVGDG